MIETLIVSIAMYYFPVTMPERIVWVSEYEAVEARLAEYPAPEGSYRLGLAVMNGGTCTIYAHEHARSVYIHEYAHCLGLEHEQIEVINTILPR
jgi:hypothetical protein